MTTHTLYILKCRDDSYYIGHTDNLEKRLADHANGQGCKYTADRLPIRLVYTEEFLPAKRPF